MESNNTTIKAVEKHPTHQIYYVNFYDDTVKTTVTHVPNKVTQWISIFESTYSSYLFSTHLLIFGLDVEWLPGNNPVAIIQICINERCLIFQLIHASSIPESLKTFLSNPNHTFFGVGIKADIEKLVRDYKIGGNARIVDLADAAAFRYSKKELKGKGLKYLCKYVLGKEMDKPRRITMSNWDNKRLTDEQVMYGCVDVLVCYNIGGELRADKLDKYWKPPAPHVVVDAFSELDRPTCHGENLRANPNNTQNQETKKMVSNTTTIKTIERHPTHQVYDVDFFENSVRTTVTHDPNKVTEWISIFESTYQYFFPEHLLIFGLNVERNPLYMNTPVATLQICINDRCLIFQIIHATYIPDSLKKFLSNPAYTFFGVGIKSDIEKLERDYGIGKNANVVELGDEATIKYSVKELKSKGLKKLCKNVLGKAMEKPGWVGTSEWDRKRLTAHQVMYACVDVLVCYNIGGELHAGKLDKHLSPPAPHIDDHVAPEFDCLSCRSSYQSGEFNKEPNPQIHETTEMTKFETKTYNVMWFNKPVRTTVTNDPSQVTKWISDVESISHDRLIFGFDVEWRPAFASGHQNPISTLQICIKDRCLIFQIIHSPNVPDSLKRFLANRAYTFVGGDVEPDLEKLKMDYQIRMNTNAVDAGDLALHRYGSLDLKFCGLKNLYMHVFGKEMQEAPSAATEWDNRTLTTDQVKFACYVAIVSYEIGVKLRADEIGVKLRADEIGVKLHKGSPIVHTTGIAIVTPY